MTWGILRSLCIRFSISPRDLCSMALVLPPIFDSGPLYLSNLSFHKYFCDWLLYLPYSYVFFWISTHLTHLKRDTGFYVSFRLPPVFARGLLISVFFFLSSRISGAFSVLVFSSAIAVSLTASHTYSVPSDKIKLLVVRLFLSATERNTSGIDVVVSRWDNLNFYMITGILLKSNTVTRG